MDRPARVLYCDCKYAEVIPAAVKRAVLRRLNAAGITFDAAADLCELAANKDPALRRIAESGDVRIIACFPRAVRWLFHAGGAPLPDTGVEVLNIRTLSVDEIVSRLSVEGSSPEAEAGAAPCRCSCGGSASHAASEPAHAPQTREKIDEDRPATWKPWFPVIDYDRCTSCGQCMGFCLFGVFGLNDEERVEVVNPKNCKTDCPACARVCPNVAIMFPKYGKEPINGDEVREEDVRHEPVKVDLSSLFPQGVHSSLTTRTRDAGKRFSSEQVGSETSGGCERCRKKLQADLDIPDKVLAELTDVGKMEDDAEHPNVNAAERRARMSNADDQRFTPSGQEWDL